MSELLFICIWLRQARSPYAGLNSEVMSNAPNIRVSVVSRAANDEGG